MTHTPSPMDPSVSTTADGQPSAPSSDALRAHAESLKSEASLIHRVAKALEPRTTKGVQDAIRLLQDGGSPTHLAWAGQLEERLKSEAAERLETFRTALRAECAKVDLQPLVRSRDPLVLRIGAFEVAIDLAADTAEFRFAQLPVRTVTANATAIVAEWRRLVDQLNGEDWSAESFLRTLRRAWKRTERPMAELSEIRTEVWFLIQPEAFRKNPIARNLKDYSAVQFAWDLTRLRRERVFFVDGVRLSLQPATGAGTKHKKSLVWLEDKPGHGHWFQTLHFVASDAPPSLTSTPESPNA